MAKFEIAKNCNERINKEDIKLPRRSTPLSAGYDLVTPLEIVIPAHSRVFTPTGITCKMADYEYLQMVPRSGLALKKGLTLLNTPGIIDADYYPNEMGVIIFNTTNEDVVLEKGERIAQLILQTYGRTEDDEPVNKERTGGFGSTGRR